MSKCNFSIPLADDSETVYTKMKSAIEKQGGKFTGDQVSGNFSVNILGNIAGSYKISGQVMTVDISSSPIFIPCSQIESLVRSQLSK